MMIYRNIIIIKKLKIIKISQEEIKNLENQGLIEQWEGILIITMECLILIINIMKKKTTNLIIIMKIMIIIGESKKECLGKFIVLYMEDRLSELQIIIIKYKIYI